MIVQEGWLTPRHPIPNVAYPTEAEARHWLANGAWLPQTIAGALERAAQARGDATAIIDATGRTSYHELHALSSAAARRMLASGLDAGDRVLVQVGIGRSAVVALLALFQAGLVPVCSVAQYRAYEMSAIARLSGARAHLVEPGAAGSFDLVTLACELRAENPSLQHVFVIGAEATDTTIALQAPDDPCTQVGDDGPDAPTPLDVALFQLSGGTTGTPKIIPRFHAEYLGYAAAWAGRLQLGADDVLLWCLPISHNAGMLCFLLPALLRQATLVLLSHFEVETFLSTIEREHVTVTGSIGPIAPRLLDERRPQRFDLSSTRLFVTLNRAADIENHLAVPSMNIFGITEGLLTASRRDAPASARHGTVGYPASQHDDVRIVAVGEVQDVADGEIGELCFRGPSMLRGYYRDPEATRAAFTADGFFRTGDLVRAHEIDGERHLSFEGRVKDNIDRGGEKFGTEEIEALLAAHPAIQESRVVGMPDRYLGERVCAFVIPRAGQQAPGVGELGRFLLSAGLAKFKLPERIETIAEMPVTSVGKLDRQALRRRIAAALAAEGTT